MRRILVIAVREYKATVFTKSFLVILLLIPAMMAAAGVVALVLGVLLLLYGDKEDKCFAVVDRTPGCKLYPLLEEAARRRNDKKFYERDPDDKAMNMGQNAFLLVSIAASAGDPESVVQQRYELSERVRQGEFFGILEIGPDVCQPPAHPQPSDTSPAVKLVGVPQVNGSPRPVADDRDVVRYQTERLAYLAFPNWAERVLNQFVLEQRWQQAGMSKDKMPRLEPPRFVSEGLSQRNAETGKIDGPTPGANVSAIIVPTGLVVLMLALIVLGSNAVMEGTKEEKLQRIAEVLLGSVRPFEFMLGKLLGLTAISLTVSVVYLGVPYAFAVSQGSNLLSLDVLAWFILYQLLALMMYGSLSLAVGAAATEIKGTDQYLMPLFLLTSLPLAVLLPVLQSPNSPFSIGMSFFPFATPMLMMVRMTVPPGIPWWQPVVGIFPVLVTTILCVYVAGRIFRIGIFMQGGSVRFTDLVKWALRG